VAVDDGHETDVAPAQSPARADDAGEIGTDVEAEASVAPAGNHGSAAPTPRPDRPEDRLARAVRGWRESLSSLGGESAMRDIDTFADATLDLSAAHPGGMAQLLAGKPTPLSLLVREPSALAAARRRARAVIAQAGEHSQRYGVAATTAALGIVSWSGDAAEAGEAPDDRDAPDGGEATDAGASPRTSGGVAAGGGQAAPTGPFGPAPVFLRPVALDEDEQGPVLQLLGRAALNPVLEHALVRAGVDVDPIVAPVLGASSDLRETLDGVLAAARTRLAEVEVTERIVVGSFAHPGQILADDLTGGWLERHRLVAALAGDPEARTSFDVQLPPIVRADREPGTERGVGDLDASQQHVLDVVASGIDVVVDAPPGTATTETVAAVVADAAASGRTIVHLAGTRRAAESLVARLIELGLDGMALDAAAGAGQGREVGALITDRLGASLPDIDAAGIQTMRTELSRLRGTLTARVRAWHTEQPEFGVSAADAMQALAEITLRRPAPRTQVRLSATTIKRLAGRGLENARGELAKAATLGTFQLRRSDSPWYGVALADGEEARSTVERVQRLGARTLPLLRQRMAVAAAQTGLEPAETLAVWVEQLRMLEGIRAALDVFQPAIFERSAADLVAATAPRASRESHEVLPQAVRRRLRKQAKDLLRPGRHVTDLHAELVAVQEEREIWRQHCTAGGWPRLPEEMSELIAVTDEVVAAVAELDGPLRSTIGDGTVPLDHVDLDRLGDHLLSLTEDESISRALPERTDAIARLEDLGLGDLLDDLAARRVPLEAVTSELDLAWWSSVLEHIIQTVPAVRGATSFADEVDRLRELDLAQVDSLVPPVALATASRLRSVAVADKTQARELFKAADRARRGVEQLDLRSLAESYGAVGRTVVPAWSVPPMLVPQVLPRPDADGAATIDLLVLDSIQNLALEQVVAAIGRARQVVVVGDVRRGGTGAVARLAEVLPHVQLDGSRTDRDSSLAAFLEKHGYADALVAIPSVPGPSTIRLDVVEGRALAVHGGVVESVPDEVEHVVDLVIDHALARPEESLAVIALNPRHAARIRDAVAHAVSDARAIADALDPARLEPFVVVDVEQAAGMRRDAIILAVGYGKTPHGRVIHQFGAVSSPRGVSLLVDALEACRTRLVVTSPLAPTDLDAQRLRSPGSTMLADLLAFAAEGGIASSSSREGSPDPLLVDLADRLWRMGLEVAASYGPPDGVRIPLAVGHPSLPGTYGVAILTDTPEYVATTNLRMRDRYWRERLERRGWDVLVLSSLDVFLDPEAAAQAVLDAVSARVRALPQPETSVVAPPMVDDDAEGTAADDLVAVNGAHAREGERPDVFAGLPMGAYSARELEALARWVGSDGVVRDVPELAGELARELGLPPGAPRAEEVLTEVAQRVLAPERPEGAEADGSGRIVLDDVETRELPLAATAAEIVAANEETRFDLAATPAADEGAADPGREDPEPPTDVIPLNERGLAEGERDAEAEHDAEAGMAADESDGGDTEADDDVAAEAGVEGSTEGVGGDAGSGDAEDAEDGDPESPRATPDEDVTDRSPGGAGNEESADESGRTDDEDGNAEASEAERARGSGEGVVQPTLGDSVLPDRAWEDTDGAWGDRRGDDDDRILRERPPHW